MKQFRWRLRFILTIALTVCRLITLPETSAAQSATALTFGPPSHGGPSASKSLDPGVRGGATGAGGPLAGLNDQERAFFSAAKNVFTEVDSVPDGLGPRFNLDSCAGCHAAPAVGGSSPATNPQVAVAKANGAANVVPSFITSNGPVREARFVRNPDGTPDGGVHDLFVITGRTDARPPQQPTTCRIAQPDFDGQLARNNVVFRIPTPTFGLGLVESVPDSYLQAVQSANRLVAGIMGISGEFNRSGNDGTITRFGWKAQNKSLLIFAGEAYNVEQGVTNELFPNEREADPNCQYNGLPEDSANLTRPSDSGSPASDYGSDTVNFAAFMRLSAPPSPVSDIATALNSRGGVLFKNIGCAACHAIKQTTGRSAYTGQSNTDFYPFSDFALHDMGSGLADGITQGNASGSEFRTAPLWGVGQRIFFLHDGRTSDIYQAIIAHASRGSEANTVVSNFEMLSSADQQALVNFLRSL
jgi:CxxC motif-containing protein (DUF1111 family)